MAFRLEHITSILFSSFKKNPIMEDLGSEYGELPILFLKSHEFYLPRAPVRGGRAFCYWRFGQWPYSLQVFFLYIYGFL